MGVVDVDPALVINAPWPAYPSLGYFYFMGWDWANWSSDYDGFPVGVIVQAQSGGSGTRYLMPGQGAVSAGTGLNDGLHAYMANYSSLPLFFRNAYTQTQYQNAVTQAVNTWGAYTIKYDYNYNSNGAWNNGFSISFKYQRVGGLGRNPATMWGYVWWGDIIEPVPTPNADYCGDVSPIDNDDPFDDMLPDIGIGQPSCTGVSEITIPLSLVPFFEWDDIVVPAVQVCFQPISLGSIILLGVEINLDTILFIIGAVAVLLWFLRS